MSVTPTTAWDGHGSMVGVDTGTHPSLLQDQFAVSAVNRTFRGGRNQTRPPIQQKKLIFDTEESEALFKYGNLSGAFAYQKHFKNTQPHIIVAVADRILKGRMFGDTIEFSTLWEIGNPEFMHAWFVQAEDRLYYQNGVEEPMGWDGRGAAYRVEGGLANDNMPTGTIMAYIHGRVVVFTSNNHAIIGDHIYGNGLTDTSGAEKFIEAQYYNDLGAIATPAMLDDITGAIPLPNIPNRNAQGPLLVLTKRGAYTLELDGARGLDSGDRGQVSGFLFSDIQQIVMTGVGGASDKSVVAANNDIWFRTSDGGMSTFKFERSESEREWGDTNLSREVQRYMAMDAPRHHQYTSSILAHNRLITSCALTVRPNEIDGYGHHRYGQGMVALDFDRGSTVNRRPGFGWDGLWTGINPVQFVSLTVDQELRPLALSHDEDGQNRIYELMPDGYRGSDMAEGTQKKIVSFYETPYLFDERDDNNRVVGKRIKGARVEVSDVTGESEVEVKFRPNHYPCWSPLGEPVKVGSEPEGLDEPTDQKDFYDIIRIGSPEPDLCEQGSVRLVDRASFFSARVEIEGSMSVDQLQLVAEVYPESNAPTCLDIDREEAFGELISCPEPNLLDYKIVS